MQLETLYQSNSCDKDCSSKLLQDSNPDNRAETSRTSPAQITQLVSDVGSQTDYYNSVRCNSARLAVTGMLGGIESGTGAILGTGAAKLAGGNVGWGSAILKGAGTGLLVHSIDYGINKALSGGDENSWYALKATDQRRQSTIFQPNGLEAVAAGVSAALPIDTRLKLGLIGASWLAGRVDNYVELKLLKGR